MDKTDFLIEQPKLSQLVAGHAKSCSKHVCDCHYAERMQWAVILEKKLERLAALEGKIRQLGVLNAYIVQPAYGSMSDPPMQVWIPMEMLLE